MKKKPVLSKVPPKPEQGSIRCTFTLPAKLFRDISAVSMALGISRSGLLVNVLGDSVHDMAIDLAIAAAESGSPSVIRRLRGKSIEKVEQAYIEFIQEAGQNE